MTMTQKDPEKKTSATRGQSRFKNRRRKKTKETEHKAVFEEKAKVPGNAETKNLSKAGPNDESRSKNKNRNRTRQDRKRHSNASAFMEKIERPRYNPDCPLCGQRINDSYCAIGFNGSGEAAHFDCIIKVLEQKEQLKPNEKIIYSGGGSFAIAVFHEGKGSEKKFEIKRKIDYENVVKEAVENWRKSLAIAPSFIVSVEKTTVQLKEEEELLQKKQVQNYKL